MGTPLSINDNEIIAENGSVFTLSIQLDGDKLALANIESGDTSPEIDLADPDDSSIFIGDSDKNIDFIETGDVVNLEIWWVLFIISLLGYIFFIGRFKRNEKINVDND